MDSLSITLTETERKILESYCFFIEGLSDYWGNGLEIVLHSLENLDHSVIKIINGHYTGRTEGAPITDLALSMLSKIKENGSEPYITYFGKNNQGEPIKSSTIAIFGETPRIIGLLLLYLILVLQPAKIFPIILTIQLRRQWKTPKRKYSTTAEFLPVIKTRKSSPFLMNREFFI